MLVIFSCIALHGFIFSLWTSAEGLTTSRIAIQQVMSLLLRKIQLEFRPTVTYLAMIA